MRNQTIHQYLQAEEWGEETYGTEEWGLQAGENMRSMLDLLICYFISPCKPVFF